MEKGAITVDDLKKIVPFYNTYLGDKVLRFLYWITDLNTVNQAYSNASKEEGINFVNLLLKELGVEYTINNSEELEKLPQGFITVSNHPYGAIDGIILTHIFASRNPDFKIMVNWILNYVKAMANFFICVDPVSNQINTVNLNGIRQTYKHLQNGKPMGFFPAGSVSKLKYKSGIIIEDREWQTNISKLIKSAQMPIIPIYFSGHNSLLFYFLGLINWKIRSLRLPKEIFNKKGKVLKVTIGRIISVEEQNSHRDIYEFAQFLKEQTYILKNK